MSEQKSEIFVQNYLRFLVKILVEKSYQKISGFLLRKIWDFLADIF